MSTLVLALKRRLAPDVLPAVAPGLDKTDCHQVQQLLSAALADTDGATGGVAAVWFVGRG